ncbi:hypothetical protein D5086_016087 [Populus alba]|uniref:Uncharacterized protein n=1 Tax=Populus alba TaxID=43335 RepID=A0ACC4BTM7_POPAL
MTIALVAAGISVVTYVPAKTHHDRRIIQNRNTRNSIVNQTICLNNLQASPMITGLSKRKTATTNYENQEGAGSHGFPPLFPELEFRIKNGTEPVRYTGNKSLSISEKQQTCTIRLENFTRQLELELPGDAPKSVPNFPSPKSIRDSQK